jgi:YNFM family putative membrane transporter
VQPIQPLFEQEFGLDRFQAIIFTTVIMFPLGFAPIFYGYFLETLSSKILLKSSVMILGILELIFATSDTYIILLSVRALQGLIIPALLTSLMSYIAFISPKDKVQQMIGSYIGATIFGGFLGRFLSGYLSDLFGWRFFFVILGIGLIGMFFLLNLLEKEVKLNIVKPSKKQIIMILKDKVFLHVYLIMFTTFFVFQGVLNFIPFQLNNLNSDVSSAKIGLVYAGYIVGLIISLNVLRIIRFFNSEIRAMITGSFIYLLGLQFFHLASYNVIFFGMFVFCAGMFIIHAIASGYINKLSHSNRAIANGLYLSFYYSGGIIGSFLPGLVFEYFGWHYFVMTLSIIVLISLFLLFNLQRILKSS